MAGAASALGVLLVFFVGWAVMECLDRMPQQRLSGRRISLGWNPAGPGQAVGRYALTGVGTLHVEGAWHAATAKAGDLSWRFEAGKQSVAATDAAGQTVGEYNDRARSFRWCNRELALYPGFERRSSGYRKRPFFARDGRYALSDDGHIVAFLRADGDDWRINPINIELDDAAEAEPGLLLLAAFVGAWLAQRDRNNDGN